MKNSLIKITKKKSFWNAVKNNELVWPKTAELHIGLACNHKCIYCYNKNLMTYGRLHKFPNFNKTKLNSNEYNNIIRELKEKKVQTIYCSGGLEFFLSSKKHRHSVMKHIIDMNFSKTKIITNGVMVKECDIPFILDFSSIRFSIDSFNPNTYTKIRGTKNKDLDRVKKIICSILNERENKSHRVKVGAAFIIMPHNVNEIDDIIEKSVSLGMDEIELKYEYTGNDDLYVNTNILFNIAKFIC